MALPKPEPGLVIRYRYLWKREAEQGIEEGRKARPAVIVISIMRDEEDMTVAVVPVTHSPPLKSDDAIAMPPKVKQRLKLDDEASWIILSEINVFTWPGPDIAPARQNELDSFEFGYLPAKLTHQILNRLRQRRGLKQVRRSQ